MTITADKAAQVIRWNLGACYLCGRRATKAVHAIPLTEGGADEDANLVAICPDCAYDKAAIEDGGCRCRKLARRRVAA